MDADERCREGIFVLKFSVRMLHRNCLLGSLKLQVVKEEIWNTRLLIARQQRMQ